MNRFLLGCCILLMMHSCVQSKLFHYCSSTHGKIQSVEVASCKNTDQTCAFKKNTNVSIAIDFQPNYSASSVQVHIIGDVAGVPVPFSIDPSEACGNYGVTCPLKTDQVSTFKLELPIKSVYPPIPVDVTIKLIDDTNANVACLDFAAKITN